MTRRREVGVPEGHRNGETPTQELDDTKRCRVCGEERPVSYYSRSRRELDGRKTTCCMCQAAKARQRNRLNAELAAAQSAGSADGHPRMGFVAFLGEDGLERAFESAGLEVSAVPNRDTDS